MNSSDLHTKVTAGIVAAAPRVIESAVNTLVQRETDKRAAALLKGIETATTLKRDFAKLNRPDGPVLFDAERKALPQTFSKARLDELKKLQEKIDKAEKAIETATRDENPDFTLLYNLPAPGAKEEPAAEAKAE